MEKIDHAKAIAEFGVRKAQVTFYDAFSNRNFDVMSELWSSDDSVVRCIHPGSEECLGRDAILETWSQIFSSSPSNFVIQPNRTKINISGLTALCSCVEVTPGGGRLECLNVYRREEGSWKMILHMASPIQRMIM
jgi:SnoaL-like domain